MPTYLWGQTERQSRGRGQNKRGQAGLKEKIKARKGKWSRNDIRYTAGQDGNDGKRAAVKIAHKMCKKLTCVVLVVLWRQGTFPLEITKTVMVPDRWHLDLRCHALTSTGQGKRQAKKRHPLFLQKFKSTFYSQTRRLFKYQWELWAFVFVTAGKGDKEWKELQGASSCQVMPC